jgi:hypothetical protein
MNTAKFNQLVEENKDLLVTLHTGRGGQFNNGGYQTITDSSKPIDYYFNLHGCGYSFENAVNVALNISGNDSLVSLFDAAFSDLPELKESYHALKSAGFDLGEIELTNGVGDGLLHGSISFDQLQTEDTGRLNLDNQYDTIDVVRLGDIDTDELIQLLSRHKRGFIGLILGELIEALNEEEEF